MLEPVIENALGTLLAALVVAPISLLFARYALILGGGGAAAGSAERDAYDRLRRRLADGGPAVAVYIGLLTRFLDAVDRFFGDAGTAAPPAQRRLFGLTAAVPLWSPAALDRCLLLALLYPLLVVFLVWALFGEVGVAERALRLRKLGGEQRLIEVAVSAGMVGAVTQWSRATGWRAWAWFGVGCAAAWGVAKVSATAVGVVIVGAGAGAGAVVGAVVGAGAVAVVGAGAVAVVFAVGVAAAAAFAGAGPVVGVGVFTWVVVLWLVDLAHRRRRQALFLSLFLPAVLLAVLTAPAALARLPTWTRDGPLLLFFGLLTAINAPFDWLSLGLTRGLLRRGIEMGGLWPLVLAAIDVVASVILIVLLTVAMVVGVQAFDLASGRAPLLPLGDLFDGIAAMPLAAKHWWVYALLLSTQFPSLLNLTIAATALFRGLPPLARWVRARMPAGEAVPGFDRQFVAFALTGQVVLGFVFGVVVEAAVVYGMLFVVLPLFGFELLEFARALAALDLPRLAMGG